ncbi:MAG: extracellular solute-binding protein [Treponema sp.]|nr:extracellular solute-binding protein [Treponema sp.]
MKMRKYFLLITFIFLTAIIWAGGQAAGSGTAQGAAPAVANFNATGYPIVNDKITLKAGGMSYPTMVADFNQNMFYQQMEAKTNIHYEFDLVPQAAWQEKFSLMFVSNDLPDVFLKCNINTNDLELYSSQGYFTRLNDLIDKYAPNIKGMLANDSTFRYAITRLNGDINNLPTVTGITPQNPYWINTKWLKTLNLAMPKTPDELYIVLKAFKEKDPNGNGKADEIPMSISAAGSATGSLGFIHTFMANFGVYCDPIAFSYVNDAKKVIYGPVTNEYRQGLAFLAKLYNEGLLDKELFTTNSQQQTAKGSGPDELLGSFNVSSPLTIVGNARHYDYSPVLLTAPNGTRKEPLQDRYQPGRFVITNKNKYPEATIRWADYCYSEEGGIAVWMGKENETYKINPDGSWDWIIPAGEVTAAFRSRISSQPGGNYTGIQPALWNKTTDPLEQHLIVTRATILPYCFTIMPIIYYSKADNTEINSLTNDLNYYVTTATSQFITGQIDVNSQAEWDKYVKQLDTIGYQKLVDIIQRNVDQLK